MSTPDRLGRAHRRLGGAGGDAKREAHLDDRLHPRVARGLPLELVQEGATSPRTDRAGNVDHTLAELRARGVDIVNEPFEIEEISAGLAFFCDPWGNMFELSQRL